ncbi:MAG: T9SS type A sorting domain-containing protein [Crocinitomicaceae bacterium]|nr:T9SS type A sorting domain-containing protein [Crocinitomicaceae bacterium]
MAKSNEELMLYPNPAEKNVLVTSKYEFSQLIVQDLQGTAVLEKELNSVTQNAVELDDLHDGVYLVTIHSQQGIFTQRLVKK